MFLFDDVIMLDTFADQMTLFKMVIDISRELKIDFFRDISLKL